MSLGDFGVLQCHFRDFGVFYVTFVILELCTSPYFGVLHVAVTVEFSARAFRNFGGLHVPSVTFGVLHATSVTLKFYMSPP